MKKALFVVLLVLVGLFPGALAANHIDECSDYCDAVNAEVQRARQAEPAEEPDISSIHKVPNTTCICNPLQTTNFTGIINNILTLLFNFAIILAPIMVVIAGVLFVMAAGDPAKISKAKQMLIWTVVGLGTIILARGLIAVIQGIIGF